MGAVFLVLSCITSITLLNSVSSVSLFFGLFTIICVVVRGIQIFSTGALEKSPGFAMREPAVPAVPSSAFAVISNLPSMFSLFSLQSAIPPFYGDIHGSRTQKRQILTVASDASTCFVFVLYTVFGIFGSLMFYGENQTQNVVNLLGNFADQDILMTVVRLGYALVVFVAYPCVLYPVKSALSGWFRVDRSQRKGQVYYLLFGVCTTILVICGSLLIPNIVVAFNLFASIFGVVLYQLIPLAVMFKLPALKKRFDAERRGVDQAEVDPNGMFATAGQDTHTGFGGDRHASSPASGQEGPEQPDHSQTRNIVTVAHAVEGAVAGPCPQL